MKIFYEGIPEHGPGGGEAAARCQPKRPGLCRWLLGSVRLLSPKLNQIIEVALLDTDPQSGYKAFSISVGLLRAILINANLA